MGGGLRVTAHALIAGYYRCDNCERTADHVRRERGYWLCDECWAAIVPSEGIAVEAGQRRNAEWHAATQEDRSRIAAYMDWLKGMQKRKPQPSPNTRPAPVASPRGADDEDWPFCACGQPREPMRWVSPWKARSLFGGPYRQHCPICELKLRIESHYDLLAHGINPEWDDEQWLDSLEKIMPEAFERGVLPDYWFRLRYPEIYEARQ